MIENAGIYLSLYPWLVHEPMRIKPKMRDIAQAVADVRGVSVAEMCGKGCHRYIAWPRHEAMWMMRQTNAFSFPQIGRFFDRDHSTVITGCRAHERRMRANV